MSNRLRTPHRNRPAGFTLVELLIVIGIIAVLVSLLLPALSGAKRQANSVKCLANLRSLGQAFQLYEADHKGYWPVAVHWFGATKEQRWPDMIAKYAANAKQVKTEDHRDLKGSIVWGCPLWTTSSEAAGGSTEYEDRVRVGYGMQYTPFDQKWGDVKYYASIREDGTVPGRYVHSRDWRVRGAERGLIADSMTHILEAPPAISRSTLWQPFHSVPYTFGMFTIDAKRHGKASTTKDDTWNGRFANMLYCDGHAAPVNVREAYNSIRSPGTETAK